MLRCVGPGLDVLACVGLVFGVLDFSFCFLPTFVLSCTMQIGREAGPVGIH
jgi:hypothetical protein